MIDFEDGVDQLVFSGGPASVDDLRIDTMFEDGTRITYGGSSIVESNSVVLQGFHGRPEDSSFVFNEPALIA